MTFENLTYRPFFANLPPSTLTKDVKSVPRGDTDFDAYSFIISTPP